MSGAIDIVLPTCARDGERLRTLGASLRRFWRVDGTLRVFADDGDYVAVAAAARAYLDGPLRVEIVATSDLLKRPPSNKPLGWWRQQLAKLCAAEVVDTDFYLTIDADFFAVRPVEYGDLVRAARGVVPIEKFDRFRPDWYRASLDVLGLGPEHVPARFVSLAPFLMARSLSRSLLGKLESKHGPGWKGVLLMRARAGSTWTEYTLYYLHARAAGLWNAFHVEQDDPLTDNSIWFRNDIEGWNPRACFEQEGRAPFFFSVVQSHTTLPPDWVWQRVQPFLAPGGAVDAGAERGDAEKPQHDR